LKDLGTLGGTNSSAESINTAGTIVGQSDITGDAAQHAFIMIGGVMVDLNTLLDSSGAGWTLLSAASINDLGQIVGYGINPSGNTEAFLLDVVPEPSACALLIGGLGLLGLVVRRRRGQPARLGE
jgi:probable HAF family extracellular repeat protein